MRIAFDVKGTIEGPKKKFVIALLQYLKAQGHEVIVWSNSYSYAVDAVRDNNLDCAYQDKTTLSDITDESQMVDLAIDDDSTQEWLASKRFIWVRDLPEAMGGILSLAESINREAWTDIKCQTNGLASRLL